MNTVKITVGNSYLPNLFEEFICAVDIEDLNEVDYCAEECVGQYLEMHEDAIHELDVAFETVAESCFYIAEQEVENDA